MRDDNGQCPVPSCPCVEVDRPTALEDLTPPLHTVMMRKRPITTLRCSAARYINISACTNANDYVGYSRARASETGYIVFPCTYLPKGRELKAFCREGRSDKGIGTVSSCPTRNMCIN